jgi:hypothetical protein
LAGPLIIFSFFFSIHKGMGRIPSYATLLPAMKNFSQFAGSFAASCVASATVFKDIASLQD